MYGFFMKKKTRTPGHQDSKTGTLGGKNAVFSVTREHLDKPCLVFVLWKPGDLHDSSDWLNEVFAWLVLTRLCVPIDRAASPGVNSNLIDCLFTKSILSCGRTHTHAADVGSIRSSGRKTT